MVNINLMRDWKTGKSRGFCYLCYQDQRSTILAVDNFNGIKLLQRQIQVDHVKEYKPPTYKESVPEDIRKIWEEGCAPKPINLPADKVKKEMEAEERKLKKQKRKLDEMVVPIKTEEIDESTRKELKEIRKRLKKQAKLEKKKQKLVIILNIKWNILFCCIYYYAGSCALFCVIIWQYGLENR